MIIKTITSIIITFKISTQFENILKTLGLLQCLDMTLFETIFVTISEKSFTQIMSF